jgi:hypothetical protein
MVISVHHTGYPDPTRLPWDDYDKHALMVVVKSSHAGCPIAKQSLWKWLSIVVSYQYENNRGLFGPARIARDDAVHDVLAGWNGTEGMVEKMARHPFWSGATPSLYFEFALRMSQMLLSKLLRDNQIWWRSLRPEDTTCPSERMSEMVAGASCDSREQIATAVRERRYRRNRAGPSRDNLASA